MPCAKIIGNEIFSIISDYIGRPIQAFDSFGNLVWQTEYDIYGSLKKIKGDRNFIPFRQLGQYEDIETGLYYNRFRYYNPETGLYISKDPIGLSGGLNVYAYVFDSNTEVDIFGLLSGDVLKYMQEMGANAEKLAQNKFGFTKNIDRISSIIPNKYHIPDGMTATTIYEVKCVARQGYTRQIKSYIATEKNVILIIDLDTKISSPLQKAYDEGKLSIERMDLKNRNSVKIDCT